MSATSSGASRRRAVLCARRGDDGLVDCEYPDRLVDEAVIDVADRQRILRHCLPRCRRTLPLARSIASRPSVTKAGKWTMGRLIPRRWLSGSRIAKGPLPKRTFK